MRTSGVSHVILGALSRGGPKSGYEIKRLVDDSTRFFWAASYGQIYPELRRLEDQGLIAGEDAADGGRRRVRFSLTPAGRETLLDWLREPDAAWELRDEALLKLFFADVLEPAETLSLVRALRADRQAILDRLHEIERTVEPARKGSASTVLSYGIGLHQWIVDWCSETERRLEATLTPEEVTR